MTGWLELMAHLSGILLLNVSFSSLRWGGPPRRAVLAPGQEGRVVYGCVLLGNSEVCRVCVYVCQGIWSGGVGTPPQRRAVTSKGH
jgi:hypothetical protein